MLIDSHCHLASHRFPIEEVPEIIARAKSAGVEKLITLATSLDDLHPNLSIAQDPAVHTCIGIHPCDVHHAPDDATSQLSAFISDPRVCAIGETGLDYYHPAPDGWDQQTFRQRQRTFLHQHFAMAARAGLNIVIHTRDLDSTQSFEDALAIYRDHHHQVRAVFHCFIGSWENAQRVLELGGILSFGGVTTFKNAHQVRDTARQCPQGTFMIETDSPYLAPEPHRGKRNEPAYICNTAQRIAELRGESADDLAAHTNRTAEHFFRLRIDSH